MLERVFQEPEFRVCCLGGFKLIETGSGTDLTPPSRKAQALIGYLAAIRKPVGRERLASLLWGDRGDEQARASLRQVLYELRSLLGGSHLLKMERNTVAIGDDVSTDLTAIVAAANSGDLEQLSDALAEWRGDYFDDLPPIDPSFDAWLNAERLRVQEMLAGIATEAAKRGLAAGETDSTRKIVRLLEQRDATNEVVLRLGLRLDHLAGDSAALHRRYERFRELLKSELDAAPSGETQRLFHQLSSNPFVPSAPPLAGKIVHFVAAGQPAERLRPSSFQQVSAHAIGKTPVRRLLSRTWPRGIAIATFLLAAVSIAAGIFWRSVHQSPAISRQEPLLAVLPFQNLSADSGSRYFSDGITEEIVDALLRTTQIRVASTRSSFQFRNVAAQSAARALAATHILTGSVQREGNQVHLVAQLADIQHNRILWSQNYDRTLIQTLALQHDIAVQIADALDMRLSPHSLKEAQHIDPKAYDYYLRGRELYSQRDPAAAAEVEEALRRAPNFAKAWSTLAAIQIFLAQYTNSRQKDDDSASMINAARVSARRALALDPDDGDALGALALITPYTRLPEIEGLLVRALRSEPNNTQLINWYASFLIIVGRYREARNELVRGYELDHVTPAIVANLVGVLLETGEFREANELIDLNRDNKLQTEFFALRADSFLLRQDWAGLANYLSVLPQYLSPPRAEIFRLWHDTAFALAKRDIGKFDRLRQSWMRIDISPDPEEAVQFLSALGDAQDAMEKIEAAERARGSDDFSDYPEWTALLARNLATLHRSRRFPTLLAEWGLFDYWGAVNRWPDFCDEPTLPFDCKAEAQKFAHSVKPLGSAKFP